MFKKSLFVTIIFIFSTLIQLIGQIVVTRMFGAKLDLDIFLAAVSIPTIMVTVIYATLNQAFLPLYGEKMAKDPKSSDSYFFSTLISLAFISVIFSSIMLFAAKPLSTLLFAPRGEVFVSAVSIQMQYLFFSFPLAVIATLLGSYFYIRKQFYRFPLAQALGNLTNLLCIVFISPIIGIWSLVIGFIISILIQIFFVIPRPIPKINLKFIKPLRLGLYWLPLIIGSFAIRSDVLLIRSFGAGLPSGYLVYLNLITKIFSIAAGVTTIGIQIVLLPNLVEYLNANKTKMAIKSVNQAKLAAIGLSVIVVLLIYFLAPFIISLLFVGGKFTLEDSKNTISLIPMFLVPALGWGISEIFYQPLFAIKKQIYVCIINVFALASSWTIAVVTNRLIGPLPAITYGLISLFLISIIGSEILWQHFKNKLKTIS